MEFWPQDDEQIVHWHTAFKHTLFASYVFYSISLPAWHAIETPTAITAKSLLGGHPLQSAL
jgi:hypothetical protein